MEDYNVNNTEANTEDTAVEVVKPVTMKEVDARKQKEHDAKIFGEGVLSGVFVFAALSIFCKKLLPAWKQAKEEKKAEKAAKKAAREAAKNPIEGNFEETEG